MPSNRLVTRSIRQLSKFEPCLFCQSRQKPPLARHNATITTPKTSNWQRTPSNITISRRCYATQRLDAQRMRIDVDKRSRVGFYTLCNRQKILQIDPHTADAIIADFLHQKDKLDLRSNILRLPEKYKVDVEALASLGIVTSRIPDLSDPEKKARLPPSQHKFIASLLLQGCAQAEEPLAIIYILGAAYLSTLANNAVAREFSRLFPQTEIIKYRKTLEKLNKNAKSLALGSDALTLEGLFLEREGQKQRAIERYQEALRDFKLKFDPHLRHPMQWQLVEPWNALGFLLKADKSPAVQAEAKSAFEKGALEGDDPLSYYELAAFEPRSSTKWLQYTSKAAASGHNEAICQLADFYQEVSSKKSPLLASSSMRTALKWLLKWRRDSGAKLAQEWLQAAANGGHKPSMLKLADYYEASGESEKAKEHLRQMLEPPSAANQSEEWPQLVQVAKRRLAGIKV